MSAAAAKPRCCGSRGQARTCPREPTLVVFGPDGLPRLACPSHGVDGHRELGDPVTSPEGLPEGLLRVWLDRERARQGKLRKELARLEERLGASERRGERITAALRGQPALALEVP